MLAKPRGPAEPALPAAPTGAADPPHDLAAAGSPGFCSSSPPCPPQGGGCLCDTASRSRACSSSSSPRAGDSPTSVVGPIAPASASLHRGSSAPTLHRTRHGPAAVPAGAPSGPTGRCTSPKRRSAALARRPEARHGHHVRHGLPLSGSPAGAWSTSPSAPHRVRTRDLGHPGRWRHERQRHLSRRWPEQLHARRGHRRVVGGPSAAPRLCLCRQDRSPVRVAAISWGIPRHRRAPQPGAAGKPPWRDLRIDGFGNIVPTGLAVSGNRVYMAEAGPIPHLPPDGKVSRSGPVRRPPRRSPPARHCWSTWSSAAIRRSSLSRRASAAGGPPATPATPNTGSLLRVNRDGTLTVISGPIRSAQRRSSFIGSTAYIVTLPGEIWTIDGVGSSDEHGDR